MTNDEGPEFHNWWKTSSLDNEMFPYDAAEYTWNFQQTKIDALKAEIDKRYTFEEIADISRRGGLLAMACQCDACYELRLVTFRQRQVAVEKQG